MVAVFLCPNASARRLAAAIAIATLAASPALAQPGDGAPPPAREPAASEGGREFDLDWRIHAGVVVVGGLAWITSEAIAKDEIAPERCRWCAGNRFDDAIRDALRWSDPIWARRGSDWLAYVVAPASAFGLTSLAGYREGRLDDWPIDALLMLESVVIAADINQLTKMSVGRARPFVRAAGDSRAPDSDDNLSFFSGHTGLGFSLAVSAGTIATIRGYRSAPWIWAAGLVTASTIGWLRIAADRHYASDVLVGAVIGSGVGLAVPLLLRRNSDEQDPRWTLAPVPGGVLLGLGGPLEL